MATKPQRLLHSVRELGTHLRSLFPTSENLILAFIIHKLRNCCKFNSDSSNLFLRPFTAQKSHKFCHYIKITPQFQKIKPAIEYIHNNFLSNEKITAEKLTQLCGISYAYIKRIFSLKYKLSPKRYILQLKMNYACDLLRYTEHTVSQVAELCGYNDVYTFSHQFKVEFGSSPINFQKKYQSSK